MKMIANLISIVRSFIPVVPLPPFSTSSRISFTLPWFVYPYLNQHDVNFSSPIKDPFDFPESDRNWQFRKSRLTL